MADLNKIYNALREKGVVTKSYEEFANAMADGNKRKNVYNALAQQGLITKSYKQFSDAVAPSPTPHTTRTQTTTPKKTDFVADAINMLRTPSSQYTRPQPSKAAGTFEMPSKYDIYHNMPDAIKRHQTPTPLKPEAVMPSVPSNAAESVWAAADKAAGAEVRKKVDEGWSWDKILRMLSSGASVTGGLGDDNAQAIETTSVAHLKTHDLQKLSDQAWAALGSKQQQSIINDTYRYLKEQYPDADDKALVDAARKMARAKSDEQMYNLAVEKNMPKSVGEFFLRKAAAASSFGSLSKGYASMMAGTRGDMEAEDTALQKYGAKHKVADIAGSVAGFAIDPLTYASGAVGGVATKEALWAGGKVLSEAAARKMSQTLGGKLLLGAVGGAANFGTFEAGGEAINQYKWGGTLDVDPETGRYVVGDFSLGKVASQMRHGLTMGGLTGAFGTWLGNVSTKAAQATSSTLGKLGVRAGELGVGLVGEGTIFATPEFISTYGDYNDIIKSVSDKNSPNYIADDKERSKYIAELKAQRGERMMDIWQDNLAMIAGFKAQHAIKSAGRTISELAASRRGKVGFVERMGRMLDGHPSLALSKEEQAELDKHGYGDLTQMVKEYKAYAQKDGDLPYNKITQLLNDKNVSEAARAKMYYYVTGHSLPMSAVIASNVIDNGDKTYTVQSLGDNGVITSRTYGNRKRADYEKARIDRQAELNGVAMAEQMFDNMDKAERLKAVCTRLAQDKGVSPETLLWLTRKDPKQMTAAEKRWIKEIEDAANEDAPQGENATVRHIKGVILDEYGVDVDKALRKAADSRTDAEKTAISAYNNELAQAVAERKNAISQGETTDAYRRGYEADTQGMRDAYVAQMYEPSEDNAETLRGVESQITESAKYQAALERDELKQMTHKDGSIHLATLKDKDKDGNGKQVYIVDGDVVMEEDGSGVDADASSKSVIIYDPASGEKKMVSPTAVDGIESLGEVKTAEQREAEINARMQDTIQSGKDWLEGNVANPVGMQIQLGDGRIATIEAMHEDGKSAIATLPDGTQFLVPNDVLQRIVNNGQYADYKARRDAEASKREAEQSTESASETATEGGQPLPEEASPKEEERREYAQGDVFDVVVDGNKMHAEIVSPKDADGRFVVNVDDGESMRTLYVTPEELAAMEYREEPSTKAEETRLASEGSSEKALEIGEQPTEEHTPTALERIPRDEKGNAQFHDVDTETAWDGLVEMSGNEETAHKVAEASLANAEKRLKAAKALKEKGETPEELLRSIKENEAVVAEAEKEVDAWKAIVGEKSRREEAAKAEAERIATEKAEAERKAAEERERAEAEEKARIEAEKKEAERIAAEKAEEEARVEDEKKAEEERKTKEGENTLKAKIEAASAEVNTDPTEAQKEAGNYKKGHVQVGTFDITIEQPEGSIRRGTDADGKKWESKMHNTYGYFRGTEGVDGDHIDVFLSNDIDGWNGRKVFVVDQYNPDGTFDEHKVMLGFNDMDEAKSDYLANYEKGWENGRRITVSTTNLEDFEKWIDSSHRKTKPFSEYSSVNKETVATDKGGEKAEKKQKKQSVFDKAKEIADKEEKKRKAEAEDDSVLGQATRAVGKKKKVNRFKYTASEKNSNLTLRGVHYANGYAYASDGYILFKEKADYPKEWEGTTRDKDGNLIDGKYPDTEKAIHRLVHIPDKEVESLPSKEVLDFAIAASKKLKGEAIPVAIDGIFFNAVNLKKFLEAVASKGMDKVVYRHPMLYATNGKDEIVMMPTVNTLEGALDIADKMESAGLPKEQIDAWKAHIEAADKKKSFDDFKKAVENAKKEGVRPTEADKQESKAEADKTKQKPLTEAERKDAEEVAGALGYRVEWVDTMEENGTIDADKKVIRIAKDAENPLVQVLGHEVAHGVRRMIGGKFRALQKAAMEVVGEKEWNELIEKKRELNAYAEGKLAEEVTCDIVGEALNDKDALKRLAESLRGEKGILSRLRDAVARMVEYFKNRGDKEGVRRMKAADKLLAEFESALNKDVASGQANPEGVDRSVREGNKDDRKSGKERQFDIITKTNPMLDDYHTGIREVDDIKTFGEAIDEARKEAEKYGDETWSAYPDITNDLLNEAERSGEITIYSSKPIKNGVFVTPSLMQATDYAGGEVLKVHSKTVPLDKVAWISLDEGQYADTSIDRSVRENRSEKTELTEEERELRDNLVERMRKGGLDVVTDSEEMQRVIDAENERTRNKRSKKSEAARKRDEALYAVDWSTAFVSGKSREEATEIRRERGRKFKEETKELYGRVLSGNFDDVTLRLIDEFIDKSTPNNPYERPISKRLPTRALQKMRGGERTGSVDALFSRICESAVGKDGKALPRAERERAIEEKKKELLKKWAIATGNWHTDVSDFSDGKEPIGSGTDSDVYLSKDGKSVIKVSKGKPYGKRFRPDVDNVALFNTVFPGSRYTIEGYGEIDGKFVRFLKQPFVDFTDSTPLTEGERVAYMEKLGFKPINKENTAFSNGEIVASDLQKSNVVRDRNGNVRVIDADMKLHTKDFGGKFSYPDAETDTRTDGMQRFLRTADGEVYGLVKDGRIYLDPKVATAETAVHEYTHLWGDMLRRKDSEQWSHTVKELKDSVLWEEVKELYPELKTDGEIADEVLSTFSGRRGAERLREEARRVADGEGGVFTKAKAIETLERVKEAIARFWEGVARMFGVNRYRSAEELADMAMKDLLDSKNPMKDESGMRKRGEVGDEGVKSLKGEEALTALDSIFGENEGPAIPPKISSFAKFKNLFKKPVRTFLGELVQVKDEVWNKILRNNRQDITGTVLPTIENADFAIRDTDGSTLYVKRFKGDGQERMYNVVVVNKHGEVEDYISSVHIKRDNNLRNKIKKGAELFLPNARTTDGTMSRNNPTPTANVTNISELSKPRFSRKPGESIFDYASRVSEDVDRSVRERVSARDEYEKKVKSKGFQTKEALQNSMLGLQEFMLAIDHASGNRRYIEDIPDFENPILGENRLSSVNKEEMHQVAKTQFKPLMSAVAKLSGNGKESGELYDYMFAKHGLERDAVMRQREAKKEFDKYKKANPKGTKTIGDFVASLEGKDYAGLTALTAEDGRVKSIQSQIDAIDEQMEVTDNQLLLRKLGGQKKRLKVDLLNAARDAADDIRKTFENNPSHDRSDINELWSRVNEVNGNTLRKLYESGLLTKEAYNDISSMYTNYIPMRGFDQTTSADAYAYLTHGDSAFNAPIKTAKGRSSKADNPIAYMQAMAESAIMQGNRNVLVKQKMLNFVRNHPSDLASVSDVWLQYDSVADEWKPVFPDNIGANDSASVVAQKMKAFEDKMKQMAEKHPGLVQRSNEAPDIPYKVVEKGQLNEHQVLVKQNGKSYIITVNGSPRAAQAANGLTNPDTDLTGAVGKVFEGAEALNRQLSSLYTTLNPDFIGSNYVRDALYSNTMVYVKEGAKYGGSFNLNFAKYNPAEMANLYARYNKGSLDTSNETHRLFLEFMQNGGETGFVNLKQIEKRKSEIAKAIKRDGRISAAQIWGGLSDAVDFANRAVENSARFAAYVTSRRSGRSVGRSVYDAKEISVNFNRKGSGSKFMGAEGQTKAGNAAAFVSGAGRGLYIFWNAGLQGLTNFSRQIGRHPGRALTLASLLFGFGALMSYLGSNDDDDENNYFNLPKYIRRSNVCFKLGDLFVTIPLPVEYRAFYGLGELASSTLAGKEDGTTKDIAKEAVSQVSQLFPIDFAEGGGGLHALIPSAVKPIVEAETNTAWTGLPIYKDNDFNKNMPEYTKVYKTANGHLVEIARALNDATGGNKYKKGFIDINPAKMEYVLKGMLGGAFSFPDKLVKTTETIMGDREFDWRNTPFANRFVKNADERTEYKALNEQYFKLKDEMDVVKQQLKGFEKEADAGNEKYEKALRQLEDSKDYERLELFKDYEKEFKGLNDELKELRMSPDYDKAEEKELQKEIAELQRQLIDEMREIKK